MKKYLNFIIIMFLIISFYNTSTSTQIKNTNIENFVIYQISPTISNQITTSYLKTSNSYNSTISPIANKYNLDSYIIITTENIANEIKPSTFISWKESLGYKIKIVNTTDSLIQDQSGNDLPAKIRNFLREYYPTWGIKYLLIIGDHETIPMRYCYPDPQNHRFDIFDWTSGEVPTDYYYADLSSADLESWDSDRDGYYGEYNQDHPDFLAEIYVGRIPINNASRIIYTLDKIVNFEQDKSSWKNNALNAGAFFYFNNEENYYNTMDGAVLSHYIEKDLMDNWIISHYSEQEGLEISEYNWPSISQEAFINDWKNNKYSIVNWQGHGWTNRVARKVWINDDGDDIPEGNEIFINSESVGEALYNSKYFCNFNYGWDHNAEYLDMYTFNLFGDPSLLLNGTIDNQPPNTPVITGPIKGKTKEFYNFTISTTDTDNDSVYYWIEWFEGCSDVYWDGPYQSGFVITRNNSWGNRGDYTISVKAKDIHGAESNWATLEITMPKTKHINTPIFNFLEKHSHLFLLLRQLLEIY